MCTGNKNQSASMETTESQNSTALCILPGIQTPFKAEVLGEENPSIQGQNGLKIRRIRLNYDDIRAVKKEYTKITDYTCHDLAVPETCLIRPVTYKVIQDPSLRKQIFDDHFYLVSVDNLDPDDIVAWSSLSRYDRTELIPCFIYYVGKNVVEDHSDPDNCSAFVIPLKNRDDTFLPYGKTISHRHIQGVGRVFKVPLSDIYRWTDISEARRQIRTGLKFDKVESMGAINGRYYEFVYRQVHVQETPGTSNAKLCPILKENMDTSSQITKEKLDQKTVEGMHESFDNSDNVGGAEGGIVPVPEKQENYNYDPLVNNKSSDSGNNTSEYSQNMDISPFGNNTKGNGTKSNESYSNSKEDYPELSTKTGKSSTVQYGSYDYSSVTRRQTKKEKPEVPKTALFGECFANYEKLENIMMKEVECGDIIAAHPKNADYAILGVVKSIREIPTFGKDQIFVGVAFEDNINRDPFEIRHVYGFDCYECPRMKSKIVFFPVDYLFSDGSSSDPSGKNLQLLKDSAPKSEIPNALPGSALGVQVDFQYEASRQDFVGSPLDFGKLNPETMGKFGIQGNANSCYIDAVIFALFSFTANFDDGLLGLRPIKASDENRIKIDAARNLLKYDIVTPLRCGQKVKWENVFKMRRALAEILNDQSYLGNFMDAETFIVSLFSTVLQVPEFYEIGEDTKDYVLQLFPPMSEEGQDVTRPSVQYLLQEYCAWNDIKLRDLPQTGFIIKLPVSNGVKQFKLVYPNLTLHLDKVLDKKDGNDINQIMNLRSVICLKKNHFTCFVRTATTAQVNGQPATWVYHDSMATDATLTECNGLELGLEIFLPAFQNPPVDIDESPLPQEMMKWLRLILSTAYICVYEPFYRSTPL